VRHRRITQSLSLLVTVAGPVGLQLMLGGCADAKQWSQPVASPDGEQFVSDVYPMLLRNCAFSTCHGDRHRFLQIYGPGRARMHLGTLPGDEMNLDEVLFSYDRARSMLAASDSVEHSLLLTKPLDVHAGGQGHKGVDLYGRNVFASRNDPGYATLLDWANSTGDPPTEEQVSAAVNGPSDPADHEDAESTP
jgi:hypothetical protein